MTGRSVPEWVGKTADSTPPKSVRLRVFERYEGRCYRTGRKINVGDAWDLDHIIPLGLDGSGNRESNLAPILKDAHKEKTAEDIGRIRKADRIRLKHTGGWPRSKAPLRSRGFAKTRPYPAGEKA